MRVCLNLFLKISTILLLAGHAWAAPVLTHNTGVNTGTAGFPGPPEASGTVNTTWSLVSVTGAAAPSFSTGTNEVRVGKHPVWGGGGAETNSAWVTPFNSDTAVNYATGGVAGVFTYETNFSLVGYEVSTAIINGSFAADNSAQIFLNGNFLATATGFNAWQSFSSVDPSFFNSGNNVLRVVVNNNSSVSGFRVEYSVNADLTPVPEIDTSTASLPLAIVALGFLALSDRRRKAQLHA